MRKLIAIMLTILVSGTLFAYELPEKPEPQPGDDETTTCTVGEQRMALWYYHQLVGDEESPGCVEYATKLEAEIETHIEEKLELRTQNHRLRNHRRLLAGAVIVETIVILGGIALAGVTR